MKKMNKKGFTIVELTIVIAVIAILAAVLIPTFSSVVKKANESAVQQRAAALYKETYALDIADGHLDGNENTTSLVGQDNETLLKALGIKKEGSQTNTTEHVTYTVTNGKIKFEYWDTKKGYKATLDDTTSATNNTWVTDTAPTSASTN